MRTGRRMCAGKLQVLLHHYVSPEDYPNPCALHQQWVDELVGDELPEYDPHREGFLDSKLISTERGRAYVEMLLGTPLPVQRWSDPREAA